MKCIHSLFRLTFAALMCVPLLNASSIARADDIELRRLLHGPDRCDHVMSLLLRHGVNNDSNHVAGMNTFHPLGPIAIPAADLGDLELVSVTRHADVVANCGPAFDVVIKNCSTRDVCGSHVTIVGLFGRILPTSPNVTSKLESLPAGQAVQITLTLPIESLAMGNMNGQAIAMNRLLVVVDSFDQFMESNEANNLRVFDVAAIPIAVAAVPETTATETPVSVSSTSATLPAVEPTPIQSAVQTTQLGAVQSEAEPASPSDSGSGLSSPDLQSAIDQFSAGTTSDQEAG
ncbi:MAG: hypothetical protein KDB00_28030 [Planctomycetales bacterium]|nr:hypothetical protein [Planctomycetales bacterium]